MMKIGRILVALGLVLGLFTFGSAQAQAQDPPEIAVTWWMNPWRIRPPGLPADQTPTGEAYVRFIAEPFEALHPIVTVVNEVVPNAGFSEKIITAIFAGNPPDVLRDPNPNPDWAREGLLEPIDDFLTEDDWNDFFDEAIEVVIAPFPHERGIGPEACGTSGGVVVFRQDDDRRDMAMELARFITNRESVALHEDLLYLTARRSVNEQLSFEEVQAFADVGPAVEIYLDAISYGIPSCGPREVNVGAAMDSFTAAIQSALSLRATPQEALCEFVRNANRVVFGSVHAHRRVGLGDTLLRDVLGPRLAGVTSIWVHSTLLDALEAAEASVDEGAGRPPRRGDAGPTSVAGTWRSGRSHAVLGPDDRLRCVLAPPSEIHEACIAAVPPAHRPAGRSGAGENVGPPAPGPPRPVAGMLDRPGCRLGGSIGGPRGAVDRFVNRGAPTGIRPEADGRLTASRSHHDDRESQWTSSALGPWQWTSS